MNSTNTMLKGAANATAAWADASSQMLERGRQSLAGGDSSTMRVLPYHIPLVAEKASGSRLWDIDGNEYIDLNMAYGPLLLGHCPQSVVDAVTRQISHCGSQLGFPTEITIRVAEKIKTFFPSMELLRFANSGTEACASAVRLARTYTGRQKLIMFEGHYHGWSEAVFTKYHAPLSELPECGYGPAIPGTSGMGASIADVITVQWNDLDAFQCCLAKHGDDVCAVMMEPVSANAGLLLPRDGYLQSVQEMIHAQGGLMIFDEVITGLRVAPGGAQAHYSVTPDITVLSKVLGGGYPVAAFGASAEIMEHIVNGDLFHGGVYSGNALVMSAAEAVLDTIIADKDSIYQHLYRISDRLASGFEQILSDLNIPHHVHHLGPLISVLLTHDHTEDLYNYRDVQRHCDFEKYIAFQHVMQRKGVYFHPNQFEPMFPSLAHTNECIDEVLRRWEEGALECLKP